MVSIDSENIGKYINQNIASSLLLRCYCSYIFEIEELLTPEDKRALSQKRRDYKHIAAQGFKAQKNSGTAIEFTRSLKWLIGRDFAENDAIIFDNVALLGVFVGLPYLSEATLLEETRNWFNTILTVKSKHSGQSSYVLFFENLLNKKTLQIDKASSDIELVLFNNFLLGNVPGPNLQLAKYFTGLRVKVFPYFEDDFFRNTISVYNENQIFKTYLLNHEDFEKKVQKEKNKAVNDALAPIKMSLDNRASNFADLVFIVYIAILLTTLLLIFALVNYGDWDLLEPKTFLFSLPLWPYIIISIHTLITHKEMSLKPKSILEKIRKRKQMNLYKEFKVSLPDFNTRKEQE